MMAEGTRTRLDQVLRDHAVDDRLASLILEVGELHDMEPCWSTGTEVALAAAHDANGALYVRRGGLTIALDRARARELQRVHGFAVGDDGGSTAGLRISSADLVDPGVREIVRDIATEALVRSEHGPRWSRRLPDHLLPLCGVCLGCGTELSGTGECPACD